MSPLLPEVATKMAFRGGLLSRVQTAVSGDGPKQVSGIFALRREERIGDQKGCSHLFYRSQLNLPLDRSKITPSWRRFESGSTSMRSDKSSSNFIE